jgi:hypothetical protein
LSCLFDILYDIYLYSNLPVTVHSQLLECRNAIATKEGHNAIKLWYLCRAIDRAGSGWADVDVKEAAKCFGLSTKTIQRYISQGKSLGFFACVQSTSVIARIYYRSLPNVCHVLDVIDIGATAIVNVEKIRLNRVLATELAAQKLQQQSKYKASKEHKAEPMGEENLFDSFDNSSEGKFNGFFRTDRFLAVSNNFATYGASQQGIAFNLGKSPETIKRRFSAKYRDRNNLPQIDRIQLLRHIPTVQVQEEPIKQSLFERQFSGDKDRVIYFTDSSTNRIGKGFEMYGEFFQYEPNIYNLQHKLVSCRATRKRLKRKFRAIARAEADF